MYTDNKPIFPNTDVRIVFTGREYSYMLLISLPWHDAKISLFFLGILVNMIGKRFINCKLLSLSEIAMPLSKYKKIKLSVWKEICKFFCRVLYSPKNKKKEFAKLFLHWNIDVLCLFQVETGFNFPSESQQ